jgi:hypothetical protein
MIGRRRLSSPGGAEHITIGADANPAAVPPSRHFHQRLAAALALQQAEKHSRRVLQALRKTWRLTPAAIVIRDRRPRP